MAPCRFAAVPVDRLVAAVVERVRHRPAPHRHATVRRRAHGSAAALPVGRGRRAQTPADRRRPDRLHRRAGRPGGPARRRFTALLQTSLTRAVEDSATSCTLPDLPPGAVLLDAGVPPGWREVALPETPCPVLRLTDPIPAGQLRNLRQSRHRASRRGGWEAAVAADAGAGLANADGHAPGPLDRARRTRRRARGPGGDRDSTTLRCRAWRHVRAAAACRCCGSAAGSRRSTTPSWRQAGCIST